MSEWEPQLPLHQHISIRAQHQRHSLQQPSARRQFERQRGGLPYPRPVLDPSLVAIIRSSEGVETYRVDDNITDTPLLILPPVSSQTQRQHTVGKMSLPWRHSSVDDYLNGTIIKLQNSSDPHFTHLSIGRYYLNGPDLESNHIILLLNHAKESDSNLMEVSLDAITLDTESKMALINLLCPAPSLPRVWKKICFHHCVGVGIQALSCPTLIEKIRIKACRIGEGDFQALGLNLQLNRLLRVLEIIEEDFRGSKTMKTLEDGLAITQSLELLDLSSCTFDDEGTAGLARGIAKNKSLVRFHCSFCELEDDQVAVLTAQGLSHHPRLQHLKLFRNHCGIEGTRAMADLLANAETDGGTKLMSLDLSYQQFEREGKLDVGILASGLAKNTTLTELSLSFNKLDDTDAELLALGLRRNNSLIELDLRANKIRNSGTTAIAKCLVSQSSIRKLFLFGNQCGATGSRALLEAIRQNKQILVLNMDYNNGDYYAIQYWSYLNKAGRRIMKDNNFHPGLWPRVLVRANKISLCSRGICTQADIIFYLLVESPGFFLQSTL